LKEFGKILKSLFILKYCDDLELTEEKDKEHHVELIGIAGAIEQKITVLI
jgi:hypothetical protein